MAINAFTPEQDVIGKRPDGRSYLIVPAGQTITMDRARSLGLLEESPDPVTPPEKKPGAGPTEFKEPEPGLPERTNTSRPYEVTGPALRLAGDHNLDLSTVEGSGPDGKILKKDVQDLIGE